MFLIDARDALTTINRALDEAASTHDAERRRELLEQALIASGRALHELLNDEDLIGTLRVQGEVVEPYQGAVVEILQDPMLFNAFLAAERRLLADLGMDTSLVDRLILTMRELRDSASVEPPDLGTLQERVRQLANEMAQARERVHEEEEHASRWSIVRRGFLVVGGFVVVGGNALVGAAASPVTGGLSIAGAAVSASLGGVMIDRGAPG